MNNREFSEFVKLLMCCDPWPVKHENGTRSHDNEVTIKAWADNEARRLGFDNWIDAYYSI